MVGAAAYLAWLVVDWPAPVARYMVPLAPLASGQKNEPVALADTGMVVGLSTDGSGRRQPVTIAPAVGRR